jgi:RNA polymerase sigma factor (TIGR02999 family)
VADHSADITLLLRSVAAGDRADVDRLMAAVYDDMRRIASTHLAAERADHTLQPTALVHEAYLKLVNQHTANWNDRLHFFSIASQIIRRILIDHARERKAAKRGGGARAISLDDANVAAPQQDLDLLALDDALRQLAEIDARQARIVELRFFGGCSVDEIAELLDIGRRTVDRDWMAAKAWLFCQLSSEEQADGG